MAPLDRWEGCLRWYRKAVVGQGWSNFDPKLAFCLFFYLALLLPALQVCLTNSLHAYPWKRHFNEIFSPSRGHLQFWMLWDEWYLNHRLTSGKQGTVIFRLISSLLCIQMKCFWLLDKRTNYMQLYWLAVFMCPSSKYLCLSRKLGAGRTPSKNWMLTSLCPDKNSLSLSDCLIFVLAYCVPTSIWAIDCFKSSSASLNELAKFQFG